ncbi:MAG TPA: helix-turn-helix domain-containing protein, partial [Spirochaetia bacterium]|nr:helix-turn-helix domain-containing protein [Spirochaetia bacterium]
RHLDREFSDHVGLSPKTLANIIRFQRIYAGALVSPESSRLSDDVYDFYYDQAHFIKYFKRFTGFPPGKFQAVGNRFGRLFISPRYVPFVQDPASREPYPDEETD